MVSDDGSVTCHSERTMRMTGRSQSGYQNQRRQLVFGNLLKDAIQLDHVQPDQDLPEQKNYRVCH